MSGAEMTIRLVDGSEAEQAAFDRSPSELEAGGVPSIGGVDSPNAARSDTVEAIAAGFATVTDKATKNDFQHDTTASVAAIHEQLAAITNGTQDDKPTNQQGDPSEAQNEGPSGEDYRGFRVSLEQLVQRFTAKFFSDPIDRLIASLSQPSQTVDNQAPEVIAPPVQTPENRETQPGPPPVQTEANRAPIIPAVGHVAPKQDEGDASATVDAGKQPASPKPVGVSDIVSKVQQRIAKIPVVGKRLNGAINAVRSTAQKFGGITKAAKSLKSAIGKTKAGKALLASGSKLAGRVAGSSFGKAVAGAGRSVVGAVARTVGATAAGGAVVSGGTGAATAVAAGGTTAAAGGGAATAAAAPLLANPVGLAVGAVVASFAALALATKALNDTFTAEADRLEQYSSALTGAKAKQQISTEMNMLGRAKEVGPGLAKITEAQTRYQDATQELWTSILAILLKTAPIVEAVSDAMTALVTGVNLGVASMDVVASRLTVDPNDDAAADKRAAAAGAAFAAAVQDIFRNNNANQPGNGPDPFLMSLLKARI